MIYKLTPLLTLLKGRITTADTWHNRFVSIFNNEEYDSELQDWYYEKLISNIDEVKMYLENGYFIDPYTGLFSFPSPHIEATHSFNLALFISQHHQHFFGKKILTVCSDFGILNVQMKLCGLNVVSSVQKENLNVGTALACIGNDSPPYPINRMTFPEEDAVFMSCVFQEDDLTYKNWELMIDKRAEGKEVFFTSNSYFFLRRYMNYDKIEVIIDPKKVYKSDDYADISYGYMNKIYRLK